MIKNKKADGTKLTGEEIAKIVTAAIAVLLLVYIGVKTYYTLFNNSEVKKSNSELEEIKSVLIKSEQENEEKKHFVLYAPQWHLFSSEFSDLCEGPFCLCLCKDIKCENQKTRACIATDKFVSIQKNGKETRLITLENPPSELKISFSSEEVYPFNSANYEIQNSWLFIRAGGVLPVFYKFDKEWLWSIDLQNWMSTNTLTVSDGKWKGSTTEVNKNFLENVLKPVKNSKEDGERKFSLFGAKLSKGVYIIKQ